MRSVGENGSEATELEVYVQLLDEGTLVFRPTRAIRIGSSTVELLATVGYDPADETWEFPPGSIVRVERRSLSGDACDVAVARAG